MNEILSLTDIGFSKRVQYNYGFNWQLMVINNLKPLYWKNISALQNLAFTLHPTLSISDLGEYKRFI